MREEDRIAGRFVLERRLGRGGMGEVWQARDARLGRHVAVKLIRQTVLDDEHMPTAVARFRREAQLAGSISHPNVVTVHDFGEDRGTHFLVQELVHGQALSQVLRDRLATGRGPLPVAETVEIGEQVCAGLAAAHRGDVIHRDLKLANLMRTADGLVKIVDFGIAWAVNSSEDATRLTPYGGGIGTPSAIAPEQSLGAAVDARADLYSLGCVLFELLTGRPVFTGSPLAVLDQHRNAAPEPVRRLAPSVPPALELLLLELLAKWPAQRPPDALTVRRRLREALAPAPPAAVSPAPQPPSPARGGGGGLVRRRALIAGAALTAAGAGTAAAVLIRSGRLSPGGPRPRAVAVLEGHGKDVVAVAFSADGTLIASAAEDDTVRLWRAAEHTALATLPAGDPVALAFHPVDRTLTASSLDKIRRWTSPDLTPLAPFPGNDFGVLALAYDTGGTLLATGGDDGKVRLFDPVTARTVRTVDTVRETFDEEIGQGVYAVAFSPPGTMLAAGSADGTIRLWQLTGDAEPVELRGHRTFTTGLSFSPDGRTLASASADGTVRLWTVASGLGSVLADDGVPVYAVAFSPDGTLLATGGYDTKIRLWDPAGRSVAATVTGHTGQVRALAFSPDGKSLVSGGNDNVVRLWSLG